MIARLIARMFNQSNEAAKPTARPDLERLEGRQLLSNSTIDHDFNGDGHVDILFRNYATGDMAVWYMNGTTRIGTASTVGSPADQDADLNDQLVGSGDFNNDGHPDLVFRNSSTGATTIWLEGGTTGLTKQSVITIQASGNTDFHAAAVADFNNDGNPDIMFRDVLPNSSDPVNGGTNPVWVMNGTTRTNIVNLPAATNNAWVVSGAGDYNQDHNPDVYFHNVTTGQNAVWILDGNFNRTSVVSLGSNNPSSTFRGKPFLTWTIPARRNWFSEIPTPARTPSGSIATSTGTRSSPRLRTPITRSLADKPCKRGISHRLNFRDGPDAPASGPSVFLTWVGLWQRFHGLRSLRAIHSPSQMMSTESHLRSLMSRYTVDHLQGIAPDAFRRQIDEYLNLVDPAMEGFRDPSKQRDLAIRFHWGHDHDFGAFALSGRMAQRHLRLIARFVDMGALPIDLAGKEIFDIGCWTGGTSLLLAAMGARVYAIDEVRKYVECVNFLARSFGVADRVTAEARSLFECTSADLQDRFDYVHYSGVLYHVSDPVLSLRICFNALRDGGRCLVETHAADTTNDILAYHGPELTYGGTPEELNRGGWNWFIPAPSVVRKMIGDVGFADVDVTPIEDQRVHAVGTRHRHVDMLRAGLSVRDIR